MKRIIGLTMAMLLVLGVTTFASAASPDTKTKNKPAASKKAVGLKAKNERAAKPRRHRRTRRHRRSSKTMMKSSSKTTNGTTENKKP